jgi:hypothetical protein
MNKITFHECKKVLTQLGKESFDKDSPKEYFAISNNIEFRYIPSYGKIYLRDLSFDTSSITSLGIGMNMYDLPFQIIDETNFGASSTKLFDSLINLVNSYQQMTDLDRELLVNSDEIIAKKIKL